MNREAIIRMAREAGGGLSSIAEPLEHPWKFSEAELIRFVALVASAEREACAEQLDALGCDHCATAIRARGQA